MNIIAFMQNAWFQPGTSEETIKQYGTDQEFHRRLLSKTMSGSRLKQAFGDTLWREIWWDNVATSHSETASGVAEIDHEHVMTIIAEKQPHLILCFGRLAERGVRGSLAFKSQKLMVCHHPNARHKTQEDLNNFAYQVGLYIAIHENNNTGTTRNR